MSLVINNNMMAANTARTLNQHYGRLAQSTQRLSTGLRVNSAADDAAGLAIRELQRAEIAALQQGARNANDAISLIQTADGALGVIDEKLIRLKELAELAATGTYDSTQRLMIASEFVAMGSEINRIANATDFNGIKLLDGSRNGTHDGSGLDSTGAIKVHFGASNSSMEDYYYIDIKDSTLVGLGLATAVMKMPDPPPVGIGTLAKPGDNGFSDTQLTSGIIPMSYIPKGAKNITITIDGILGWEDDIQIFTRSGVHIAGTDLDDISWVTNGIANDIDATGLMTEKNGFEAGAAYHKSPSGNVTGTFNDGQNTNSASNFNIDKGGRSETYTIGGDAFDLYYSGDFDRLEENTDKNDGSIWYDDNRTKEQIRITGTVPEDLLIFITGRGIFNIEASWDYMPDTSHIDSRIPEQVDSIPHSIETQEAAQQMLEKIDAAIVKKDRIRAHLGALQNRLENTISNLNIQAENLQAAESRISDVDVATEMTEFVRNQILTQSAVAMLSQANSLPQMAMQLIGG